MLNSNISEQDLLLEIINAEKNRTGGSDWISELIELDEDALNEKVSSRFDSQCQELTMQLDKIQIDNEDGESFLKGVFNQNVSIIPDKANLCPIVLFDKSEITQLSSNVKGRDLRKFILQTIRQLQKAQKEFDSGDVDWNLVEKAFAAVGIVATGWGFIKVIIPYLGKGLALSTIVGLLAGGAAGAVAAAGIYIGLAITALVLIYLMFRQAKMLFLVLNHSKTSKVVFNDFYRRHGKVIILPGEKNSFSHTLPPSITRESKEYIYGSFIGFSKKRVAVRGCAGAFGVNFENTNNQTTTGYISYQVPISLFGGWNGCGATFDRHNSSKEYWENKSSISDKLDVKSAKNGNSIRVRVDFRSGTTTTGIIDLT